MAHLYIEPKYNSGEKVAGGTLAIYADESQRQLLTLWAYADLKLDDQGGGRLANPVPIDNNGINSSPIFMDLEEYGSAYYVLRDARNATIRQGYVVPMSWQGGAAPNPVNPPWTQNSGDPFWGYEIVSDLPSLASHAVDIGRPLFLAVNAAGDKSGGLVVYQTSGQADSILSFPSIRPGTIWKAREEFINHSYLRSGLGSGQNPFQYIDNLNAVNGWNYGIRLDSIPAGIQNYTCNSKLLIDSVLNGAYTASLSSFINMANSENLIITSQNGMNLTGSGNLPFYINVQSGQFDTQSITDQNGNNFIRGIVDCLRSSNSTLTLTDLTVKKFANGNQPMNIQSSSTNREIHDLNSNAIAGALTSSALSNLNLRILTVASAITITVDADINFEAKGIPGMSVNLTGNGNAYFIKPSPGIYVPGCTVKATNAEFYNDLNSVNGNVQIATYFQGGTNPSIAANNLLQLGSWCKGTLKLDSVNSGKLYVDSKTVDIESTDKTLKVYVQKARKISYCNIILEMNLQNIGSQQTGFGSFQAAYDIDSIENSEIHAGTRYSPWVESASYYKLNGCKLSKCDIRWQFVMVMEKCHAKQCSFSVEDLSIVGGGRSLGAPGWTCNVGLGNGTTIEDSKFSNGVVGLWGAGDGVHYSNINFNNNDTDNNFPTKLELFNNSSNGGQMRGWTTPVQSAIIENVNYKGNGNQSGNTAFVILAGEWNNLSFPLFKGHIEITGYYDYSLMGGTGLAAETFPVKGKNIAEGQQWTGDGEYTGSLCLFTFGETLKYANESNGAFVVVTSHKENSPVRIPLDLDYINANLPDVAPATVTVLSVPLPGTFDSYGLADGSFTYPNIQWAGIGASALIEAINSSNGLSLTSSPGRSGDDTVSGSYVIFQFSDGRWGGIESFENNMVSYWMPAVWNPAVTATVPESWDNSRPIAKTNYAEAYAWSSGTDVRQIKCLLCCNCDVRLYRIRE